MNTALLILAGLACSNPSPLAPNVPPIEEPAEATSIAWKHFGSPFTQKTAIGANALLAEPQAYVDQSVRVHGRLADVCQKAGCWMVLADQEGRSIRVTTGHEFFIDRDTIGDQADIEGKIERKEVEAETVEHFKSEASSPDSIIPEQGKTHTYELVATTVAIRN
jgi:hypothetical protein